MVIWQRGRAKALTAVVVGAELGRRWSLRVVLPANSGGLPAVLSNAHIRQFRALRQCGTDCL